MKKGIKLLGILTFMICMVFGAVVHGEGGISFGEGSTLQKNEKLIISVPATKTSADADFGSVYCALYEDGTLISIHSRPAIGLPIDTKTTLSWMFYNPIVEGCTYSYKVFAWDNMQSMCIPVSEDNLNIAITSSPNTYSTADNVPWGIVTSVSANQDNTHSVTLNINGADVTYQTSSTMVLSYATESLGQNYITTTIYSAISPTGVLTDYLINGDVCGVIRDANGKIATLVRMGRLSEFAKLEKPLENNDASIMMPSTSNGPMRDNTFVGQAFYTENDIFGITSQHGDTQYLSNTSATVYNADTGEITRGEVEVGDYTFTRYFNGATKENFVVHFTDDRNVPTTSPYTTTVTGTYALMLDLITENDILYAKLYTENGEFVTLPISSKITCTGKMSEVYQTKELTLPQDNQLINDCYENMIVRNYSGTVERLINFTTDNDTINSLVFSTHYTDDNTTQTAVRYRSLSTTGINNLSCRFTQDTIVFTAPKEVTSYSQYNVRKGVDAANTPIRPFDNNYSIAELNGPYAKVCMHHTLSDSTPRDKSYGSAEGNSWGMVQFVEKIDDVYSIIAVVNGEQVTYTTHPKASASILDSYFGNYATSSYTIPIETLEYGDICGFKVVNDKLETIIKMVDMGEFITSTDKVNSPLGTTLTTTVLSPFRDCSYIESVSNIKQYDTYTALKFLSKTRSYIIKYAPTTKINIYNSETNKIKIGTMSDIKTDDIFIARSFRTDEPNIFIIR